jgi:hypothetical protein
MRRFILAAAAALVFASGAGAASSPHCSANSQPCGNTCIAKGKVCHITPPQHPVCKPGVSKPCGQTCIALNKTCHV